MVWTQQRQRVKGTDIEFSSKEIYKLLVAFGLLFQKVLEVSGVLEVPGYLLAAALAGLSARIQRHNLLLQTLLPALNEPSG